MDLPENDFGPVRQNLPEAGTPIVQIVIVLEPETGQTPAIANVDVQACFEPKGTIENAIIVLMLIEYIQ